MTRVLFWAALMDQEEEAQVVIPDLEDEDVLGSCLDATLNNGFYSPNGPPADPRSTDISDAQHLPPPFPTVFLFHTHFHKQAHSWKTASFPYRISHYR